MKFVKKYPRAIIRKTPYDGRQDLFIVFHEPQCSCCEGWVMSSPTPSNLYAEAEARIGLLRKEVD